MNLDNLTRHLAVEDGPLRKLREKAGSQKRRILFPEAADPRVQVAAAALARNELAHPLLLGRPPISPRIEPELAQFLGPEHWLDPADDTRRREVAEHIHRRRRHRNLTQGQSHVLAGDPLHQAATLVHLGVADALVAGATCATALVARAVLWCIGTAPGIDVVSGACLMLGPSSRSHSLLMADCAVVPDPDPAQLVQIAQATVQNFHRLWARWPAVAMLSFSTRGSAVHPAARKVAAATRQLNSLHPEWRVVGEVQADAALAHDVARTKGIDWGEAGTAEVLIFPDLGSANIGHKLVERLGGWRAVGPLFQGLHRPVCDLSRGCSALDVVDAAVLVTLTAE